MIHSTVINDWFPQTIHISVDHITPKRQGRKFVTPNNFKEQWFPKIKLKPSNSTMLTKEIEILSWLNTEKSILEEPTCRHYPTESIKCNWAQLN